MNLQKSGPLSSSHVCLSNQYTEQRYPDGRFPLSRLTSGGPCENSGEASGHRVRTPQRRCLENLENTPESRQNNVVRNKDVRFIVSVCGQELVSSTFPQPREDPGEAGHWPVVAMIVFPSPISPGLSLSSESAHCRQMSQMTEHLFIIFKSAVLMIKQ